MSNATLLVVTDDPVLRDVLQTVLSLSDFEVHVAAHTAEGLHLAATRNVDAAIADYDMPGLNGLQFCQALQHQNRRLLLSHLPVWIITGRADPDLPRQARDKGARGVIIKPAGALELGQLIVRTVRAHLATTAA